MNNAGEMDGILEDPKSVGRCIPDKNGLAVMGRIGFFSGFILVSGSLGDPVLFNDALVAGLSFFAITIFDWDKVGDDDDADDSGDDFCVDDVADIPVESVFRASGVAFLCNS